MFGMSSHTGQSPSTKSCFWPVRNGFWYEPVGGFTCTSEGVRHNSVSRGSAYGFVRSLRVDDVDDR